MRLLIIEDDKILADALAISLRNNNYVVDIFYDARVALQFANFNKYDLLISDYLMPNLNGWEFIKEVRKNHKILPILILSAIPEITNKTKLLNDGADDYLTKPFSVQELISRINTLIRRKENRNNFVLTFSNLILDLNSGEAIRGGKNIYLTSKEIILLKYLMENSGTICSKLDIINTVWGEEAHHLSNTLEAHILKLRKKIDFKKPKLIHTRASYGYKIDLQP